MNIGKNIALYRKAKKLTQNELGAILEVSNQAVSKWESNTSYPGIMLLPKIANALGISLEELYGIACSQDDKQEGSADNFPDLLLCAS